MVAMEEGSPSVPPSNGGGLPPRLAIFAADGGEETSPADVPSVREDSARASQHGDGGMEPEDGDPTEEENEARGEEHRRDKKQLRDYPYMTIERSY